MNDVYQLSKNLLNLISLQHFLSFCQQIDLNTIQPGSVIPGGPPPDVLLIGTERLTQDALNGNLVRWHWPVGGIYESNPLNSFEQGQEILEIDAELLEWVDHQ